MVDRWEQKHISVLNFEGLSSLHIKLGTTGTLLDWDHSIWCKEIWNLLQKVYGESCFYPNINRVTSFIALFYSLSFPIYNTHNPVSPNLTRLKSVAAEFFQSCCRSLLSSLLVDKSCASCSSFWTGQTVLCLLGLKCGIASAHGCIFFPSPLWEQSQCPFAYRREHGLQGIHRFPDTDFINFTALTWKQEEI